MAEAGALSREPEDGLETHGLAVSALLHLLPGAISLLVYLVVCEPLITALGLPRQAGFVLKVFLALLPIQLGAILYLGRRRNGRLSLEGVVRYRRKLPAKTLVPLVAGLFLWALLVIALLARLDDLLFTRLFWWVPVSLLPETEVGGYRFALVVGTQLASLLTIGIIAPVVEELYFRGFLLPRVAWMGAWAPVWNTVLFNAYHFWSPWRLVSRTIFTLPMVIAVWRKRSLSIGIWWHCLGNVLGELLALRGLWLASGGGQGV